MSQSSSSSESYKPIEYYIAKATDPYADAVDRKAAVNSLCEKVNTEAEAAQIAANVLAHKILTPNQEEAFLVLQTVEALVMQCGSKVHTKIGKYRFLNQMVKLISNKHQGTQTSKAVKDKAIVLLYTWQKSMRHIEKFKEVYDNLRDHNAIPEDPVIPDEQIPQISAPAPKLAVFEDEEKSAMLKQLLNSTNPDDLQAANRLIKSLVRTEDLKIERVSKRLEDIERARRACESMEHLLFDANLGLSIGADMEHSEIRSVFDTLLNARPMLYRYASEAAENNDEMLVDILSLNDQVNRLIQKYKSHFDPVSQDLQATTEECGDLLGGELTLEEEIIGFPEQKTRGVESSSNTSVDDVPFIGLDSLVNTPQLTRRDQSPKSEVLSDLSSLLEGAGDIFTPKPSPSSLSSTDRQSRDQKAAEDLMYGELEALGRASSVSLNTIPRVIPDGVSFAFEQIRLAVGEPKEPIHCDGVRVLVHITQNSPVGTMGLSCALLSVVNFSTQSYSNVQLQVRTEDKNFNIRCLPPSSTKIRAFSPCEAIPTIRQVLLILPLHREEPCTAEFVATLSLKNVFEEVVSGMFTLSV